MCFDTAHGAAMPGRPDEVENVMDSPAGQRVAEYWREGERLNQAHPGSLAHDDLERFLPQWLASLDHDALSQGRPWITFAAAEALEEIARGARRVFEWGAGGSTIFFGKWASDLVTVEHDRQWLQRTAALLPARRSFRWRAYWIEPRPRIGPSEYPAADPQAYASTDARYAHMSFQDYAQAIERYPDNYFDVVLIDGRARPACFRHAVAKVKAGGYIVIDNAEREAYAWIREAAGRLGFEVRDYWGPGPYNQYFWCTSILRRNQVRFALNELDLRLEAFVNFDNGIFVEAGANDGVSQSNTLYLESQRGWRGLLIEPIYERVLECRRFRPHAQVVHAALVEPQRAGAPVALRYANLMSVIKDGMRSPEEEDAHIKAGCAVQKIESHEFFAPTATLSGLLDQYGVTHVDLLSLDVEGYEAQALKGLDVGRHRPRYILVEARYRNDVHAVLAQHYELVAELSHHDLLYRFKGEADTEAKGAGYDTPIRRWSEAPVCVACGSVTVEHLDGMFDDRYGYPGYFSLFRCSRCGHMQTVPLLADDELPELYARYYPRREIDVTAIPEQVGDPQSALQRWRMWLSGTDNQGQYAAKPGMAVLDYGCGAGHSLIELQKLGAEGYGLEADPNVRKVAEAHNLRIHIGTIDDNPFPGVKFDLIVLNQVLEHIPQPDRLLPKLAARLRPGGSVVMSFPNCGSIFRRAFGRDWINWHVPYHLHHFSRRSAKRFFARHGWRVVSMRTITPNLWTILQARALVERTRMGIPNSLWTGQPRSESMGRQEETRAPSLLVRALYRFALATSRRMPRLALIALNRTCDALGLGDSILVSVVPDKSA